MVGWWVEEGKEQRQERGLYTYARLGRAAKLGQEEREKGQDRMKRVEGRRSMHRVISREVLQLKIVHRRHPQQQVLLNSPPLTEASKIQDFFFWAARYQQ
jgi:hypothetical protein